MEQVTVNSRAASPRCPLCREELEPASPDLVVCRGCATVAHRDCLASLGGGRCSTRGCDASVLLTESSSLPAVVQEVEVPGGRVRDGISLAMGVFAAGAGLFASGLYLGRHLLSWDLPRNWQPFCYTALSAAFLGLAVGWGRNTTSSTVARALCCLALAVGYPPMVAMTLLILGTIAGIFVFGLMRTGGFLALDD